jgi:hypothetical protein
MRAHGSVVDCVSGRQTGRRIPIYSQFVQNFHRLLLIFLLFAINIRRKFNENKAKVTWGVVRAVTASGEVCGSVRGPVSWGKQSKTKTFLPATRFCGKFASKYGVEKDYPRLKGKSRRMNHKFRLSCGDLPCAVVKGIGTQFDSRFALQSQDEKKEEKIVNDVKYPKESRLRRARVREFCRYDVIEACV